MTLVSLMYKLPSLSTSGPKKFTAFLVIYGMILASALAIAFALRNYSLSKIATSSSANSVTIAAAFMKGTDLEQILAIALKNQEVQERLDMAGSGKPETYLNYVVPLEWYLPDIPVENIPTGFRGHHQPDDYDRDLYKVLITREKLRTGKPLTGLNIIKNTYGRDPVVLVKVNKARGEVIGIETPPPHVRWGDIPTPLF